MPKKNLETVTSHWALVEFFGSENSIPTKNGQAGLFESMSVMPECRGVVS